jgi:hypothetical protein
MLCAATSCSDIPRIRKSTPLCSNVGQGQARSDMPTYARLRESRHSDNKIV